MSPLSRESEPENIRQQEEPQEAKDAYKLSPEDLRCPKRGIVAWYRQLVAFQREGIKKYGVRPQMPRGLSRSRKRKWLTEVWRPYLKTRSEKEQLFINKTKGPGRNRHTGPRHSTLLR